MDICSKANSPPWPRQAGRESFYRQCVWGWGVGSRLHAEIAQSSVIFILVISGVTSSSILVVLGTVNL